MDGKQVTESSVVMAQMMIPQDANPAGNIHGGVVVKIIDEAAGVVACPAFPQERGHCFHRPVGLPPPHLRRGPSLLQGKSEFRRKDLHGDRRTG